MDNASEKKIKCPYCGWIRSMNAGAIIEVGSGVVMRGIVVETVKAFTGYIKSALEDTELNKANAWVDTKCPHCLNTYLYHADTKEVKR